LIDRNCIFVSKLPLADKQTALRNGGVAMSALIDLLVELLRRVIKGSPAAAYKEGLYTGFFYTLAALVLFLILFLVLQAF
jgi:hypothetical protein